MSGVGSLDGGSGSGVDGFSAGVCSAVDLVEDVFPKVKPVHIHLRFGMSTFRKGLVTDFGRPGALLSVSLSGRGS